MLNNIRAFNRTHRLIEKGDKIVCAVSGGADSMALLWSLYLLKEEWDLTVEAAHFNHHLRGEESDRDETFVRDFCDGYGIPLHVGSAQVMPGKKGLEAAAREARYAFLRSLPGKIATAHTADDNAETLLLHLVRGTGLKGLGGIMPKNGNVIRPMLSVTRSQVENLLEEYCVPHIEDSSNEGDQFLRNRLRHGVMPLLRAENPRIAENLSAMALRLRLDEDALSSMADPNADIPTLRSQSPAVRARSLEQFLKNSSIREPEGIHIEQAEALVFSSNPSARADFPGVTITRRYDRLEPLIREETPAEQVLTVGSTVSFGPYRVTCVQADAISNTTDTFTVCPHGPIRVRSRRSGDALRLSGGTKSLKKRLIDKKIPAGQRALLPVLEDDLGILAVAELGADLSRRADALPAIQIKIVNTSES